MGQGEETKTRPDSPVEILERGEIFFFYRPRVNRGEAHSPDDVQRLYIVLRPESGERPIEDKQEPDSGKEGSKRPQLQEDDRNSSSPSGKHGGHGAQKVNIEKERLMRFIVMGRKSLPDPSKNKGRPFWGFVDLVTTNLDHVKDALKPRDYKTASQGKRHEEPARAVGEGVYRILRHNPGRKKMHTHLVYKLELPAEGKSNEPQEALHIERQGSFVLQIKNPESAGGSSGSRFGGLSEKRRAQFPAHLQGEFGHSKRFGPADPPDFLNYEGCEFLMIAAADDIEEELGLEVKTEDQCEGEEEGSSCSDLVKELGDVAVPAPLLEGTWA